MQSNADSKALSETSSPTVPDISDASLDWHTEGDRQLRPSGAWRQWLFDSSSLTKLLIEKSGGDFHVELRSVQWSLIPEPATRACFGPVAAEHRFWSRKVVLVGKARPWVLAHTLIPEFSLSGPLEKVLQLNEKPLGEYLFSHPDLIRSGIDITPMAGDAWGRRSLFYLFDKPIMVAEFFLPAILD